MVVGVFIEDFVVFACAVVTVVVIIVACILIRDVAFVIIDVFVVIDIVSVIHVAALIFLVVVDVVIAGTIMEVDSSVVVFFHRLCVMAVYRLTVVLEHD